MQPQISSSVKTTVWQVGQLVKGEFLGTELPFCSFYFHIFIHTTDACSKSCAGTAQALLAS